MISQEVMDKIIKVPTEEEYIEELTTKLGDEGFKITNFSKGGVFYIIIWIVVHGLIELKQLGVDLINSALMTHCPDDLVEVRAADYSKALKDGINAQGEITVYRREYVHAVKILKGHPFTTNPDAGGQYLTFYASEDTVLPEGEAVCTVPVIAAESGIAYNVAAGRICRTLVQIEGYEKVINEEGWLIQEGTETETISSLRKRCLNSRAENAVLNIDRKLKSIVESVPGVIVSNIDSQSPRGEGTTDIIVTGQTGEANEALLEAVREAISGLQGSYGDYLVKSSEPVAQDFDLVLYIESGVSTEGYEEQVQNAITNMMNLTQRSDLNRLYRDEIIGTLIQNIPKYKRCAINTPAEDVAVNKDQVLVLGNISVQVLNIE